MRKAFTLVELLVVVAILGILTVIAVPQFSGAMLRAKVSKAQGDMNALNQALVSFANDNHDMFPLLRNDFYKGAEGGDASARLVRLSPLTTPTAYIGSIPNDPFTKGGIVGDERTLPPNDVYVYWDEETTKKFRDANAYKSVPSLIAAYGLFKQKRNQEGILLISYGPDRIFRVKDDVIPANASSSQADPKPDSALEPEYDPSNGLHSYGNLYYAGVIGKEH